MKLAQKEKKQNKTEISHFSLTCILHITVQQLLGNNGAWNSELGWQKEIRKHKRKAPPDTLSQTHRLIASLSPEMEAQRFYLCTAARGSWPRGRVQGSRRSAVVHTGGELRLDQAIVAPASFWGVAKSQGWWGDSEWGEWDAVRRSQGRRPWAFSCEKSFGGKTPGILYLFVSEIFICHAGRFIMGLSVSSAHSRVRTCCPEHLLWISRE